MPRSSRIRDAADLVHFDAGTPVILSAEMAPSRSSRPTFDELGPEEPTGLKNRLVRNPPLYYSAVGAGFTAAALVLPGAVNWSFDQILGLGRLLNALLLVPIPALIYVAARRMRIGPGAALLGAAIPLAVPQLAHIGAAHNNDNLLVVLGAIGTVVLVPVATGDFSARRAVLVGLIAGFAMLTKAFGLLFPVWVLAVYAIAGVRGRDRGAAVAAATSLSVSFVAGGWWWARNLLTLGVLEQSSATARSSPAGFEPDTLFWLTRYGAWMVERFWGWFGWFDFRLPIWLVAVATVAVLALAGAGAVRLWRRDPCAPAFVVVALAPILMLFAGVGAQSYNTYVGSGSTPAIQGRYLFAGIAGLAVLIAAGVDGGVRTRKASALGLAALLLLMHGHAVIGFLRHYWGATPDGSLTSQVDAVLAWAPWPPGVVITAWVSTLVLGSVAAYRTWREVGSHA